MKIPSILINEMLSELVAKKALSLHLSIGSLPSLRIDNELKTMENQGIVTLEIVNGIINSFIDEEEVLILKEKKELVVVREFAAGLRFRVNVFYQKRMPALSFYFIPNKIKSFNELKLPRILNEFVGNESGLFVVAGSYASGKTTTINTLIENINNIEKKYIITIENPIEFIYTSKKSIVLQREIGNDVNNVQESLEYCLKEDVDIVSVSCVDDDFEKYSSLLFDLAAGNSLVILELNSNTAVNAIEKIINALAQESSSESACHRVADTLKGIIVQKLIPKKGGGMVLAYEILKVNSPIRSLIRDNKIFQISSIIETSQDDGMISMEKSIKNLKNSQEII